MAQNIQPIPDFVAGEPILIKVSHNPVIDLTGYSFEITVRATEDAADPLISYVWAVPITPQEVVDAAALGEVVVVIPATETAILPGRYWASIKRIDTAAVPKTIMRTDMGGAGLVECFKNLKG